ncbi:MAG: START domain-containing protein [Cyclobacteriaceae bacterium]
MSVFRLLFLPLGMVLLYSFSSLAGVDEWTLRKDKEGIKIYTREAANTNIKEVKAELTITASIDDITKAIIDVENYSNWMENILNPKVLKRIGENGYYLYYEMDAPWPTDDRDIVNLTTITRDDSGTTVISSSAKPDYIPKKKSVVRITLSEGSWELKPLDGGKVEITHVLLASPGGNIPDWVINMFIVNHPFETHLNLKNMLE